MPGQAPKAIHRRLANGFEQCHRRRDITASDLENRFVRIDDERQFLSPRFWQPSQESRSRPGLMPLRPASRLERLTAPSLSRCHCRPSLPTTSVRENSHRSRCVETNHTGLPTITAGIPSATHRGASRSEHSTSTARSCFRPQLTDLSSPQEILQRSSIRATQRTKAH